MKNTSFKNSFIWREHDQIIQSVPGAGPVLAISLLAGVPEFGVLNSQQIAAIPTSVILLQSSLRIGPPMPLNSLSIIPGEVQTIIIEK